MFFYLLSYTYADISRVCCYLTPAAAHRAWNVDSPCVGTRDKYLLGKQSTANVARVGLNKYLRRIAAIKGNVPRASRNI